MSYLVSLGLLVLVAAWVVGVYNRLRILHSRVAEAWEHWRKVTRRRNACVEEFAAAVSVALPRGDMLPRSMRRLAQDSNLELASATAGRADTATMRAAITERELHRVLRRLEPAMEALGAQPSTEHLQFLGAQVNITLFHQGQHARIFNRLAADYNAALRDTPGRILSPIFGFEEAVSLDCGNGEGRG